MSARNDSGGAAVSFDEIDGDLFRLWARAKMFWAVSIGGDKETVEIERDAFVESMGGFADDLAAVRAKFASCAVPGADGDLFRLWARAKMFWAVSLGGDKESVEIERDAFVESMGGFADDLAALRANFAWAKVPGWPNAQDSGPTRNGVAPLKRRA